jgi:hypothetical protein
VTPGSVAGHQATERLGREAPDLLGVPEVVCEQDGDHRPTWRLGAQVDPASLADPAPSDPIALSAMVHDVHARCGRALQGERRDRETDRGVMDRHRDGGGHVGDARRGSR